MDRNNICSEFAAIKPIVPNICTNSGAEEAYTPPIIACAKLNLPISAVDDATAYTKASDIPFIASIPV
eukprot:CAMPEP_0196818080 /NCGR_PEP_ID=MMETSP1362-20130617/63896_1 /TAXON_ID=163516 /ORGANISM="Leptocylindrus danicus, Strain CCMP1856" /LENGTH=67 /DNA_ID=CAMNT_0042196007 /DNA_START=227 /DNA_END=430 /DNA_ORIENTATION=+